MATLFAASSFGFSSRATCTNVLTSDENLCISSVLATSCTRSFSLVVFSLFALFSAIFAG